MSRRSLKTSSRSQISAQASFDYILTFERARHRAGPFRTYRWPSDASARLLDTSLSHVTFGRLCQVVACPHQTTYAVNSYFSACLNRMHNRLIPRTSKGHPRGVTRICTDYVSRLQSSPGHEIPHGTRPRNPQPFKLAHGTTNPSPVCGRYAGVSWLPIPFDRISTTRCPL